jgi:hypothetical protein
MTFLINISLNEQREFMYWRKIKKKYKIRFYKDNTSAIVAQFSNRKRLLCDLRTEVFRQKQATLVACRVKGLLKI